MARAEAALRRGSVGRMRIGISVEELRANAKPTIVGRLTDEKLTVYVSPNSSSNPILTANITDGTVSRFRILSQRFSTDIGIGVSATLRDLSRFYRIAWVAPGCAYVDSLKIRFEIRDGKIALMLAT